MSSFNAIKREQLQADLDLKLKQYEDVAEALRLNLSPGNTTILEVQLAKFGAEIQQLEAALGALGDASSRPKPFMAPALPPYFVERPKEFEAIVGALVDQNGAVATTAAIKGAGGFGKTTLAIALCHDSRVNEAFHDGILWVVLGETPSEADLFNHVGSLIYTLTGEMPPINNRTIAKSELTKAIGDRYILLVMDDLWRKTDADIFLTGGSHSAVLITTRLDAQLPDQTRFKQPVDAMLLEQAVKVLTWEIKDVTQVHQPDLKELARLLGEWVVLLRLVNATLSKRIQNGESLAKALIYVKDALKMEGLVAFDSENPQERSAAVRHTITVSLKLLNAERQGQFTRLAVFPEDAHVPFTTLEKLWGVSGYFAEKAASALNDAGLLLNFELDQRTIRLHDVVRSYLILEHNAHLPQWQADFIKALGDLHTPPDDYIWRNTAYHLREAGQLATLRGLLLDFNFLQAKLNATDANALIGDCKALPEDDAIRLIQSALSLSAHLLVDQSQLPSQLQARLMSHSAAHPPIAQLLEACDAAPTPHLIPIHQTFAPAGGPLLRTLEGHTSWVWSVAVSGDYAVSAAQDATLKVWNWQEGSLLRTLEGHTAAVRSVALSGEYAVSVANDGMLKVWNWQAGTLLRTLEGHVAVCCVALWGEYAVSAAEDGTLTVWNWQAGTLLRTLEGHTAAVRSVALSGEYAMSGGDDQTVKVWNWQDGTLLRTLEGHAAAVLSVAVSGDTIVSGAYNGTLKVWDWQNGSLLRNLEGHAAAVRCIALSGDYAVSGASDGLLLVWNWKAGSLLRPLEGHFDRVRSVALSGAHAVSGSDDRTVRVWNWQDETGLRILDNPAGSLESAAVSGDYAVLGTGDGMLKVWNWQAGTLLHALDGHAGDVLSVALSGEYAVSGAADGLLKVWNWQEGRLLRTLEGHADWVRSVSLSGEYAVSSADDGTLKVWNWQDGTLLRTLEGHASMVMSVALSGAYAVSGGDDGELKVWNWQEGTLLRTLEGYAGWVMSVALSGAYAVSAADHGTMKVWNWQDGTLLRPLEGHFDRVSSVALLGDYAVSGSADRTLKVWNWQDGTLIASFSADAPQQAVSIAPDASVVVSGGADGRAHFLRPSAALRRLFSHSH